MKENKIEKLILDLSNRWEVSPEEAVDRLNSMNESEINKLINSMTKKFQIGGRAFGPNIPYGNYRIVNKETVILPKKSGITQTQIDSVYNAEQEVFQKRASELIPELEQKIVDLRDKMEWDKSQRVKPIPGIKMPVTNSDPQYSNSRNQKFENGGFIDCLRAGGTVSKCKCGCDKIAKAAKGTNEDGLTVQTPKNEEDLKWENIKSSFGYGKAAKYITKDGKWQKTEYDYPETDLFGNGNDFTLWVRRDPQTGVVGTAPSDSLVSTKALPFIKLPIRMSGDAPAIRSTVKQEKGGELKKYNSPLPKKSKCKK